jgi:hypothetical protein
MVSKPAFIVEVSKGGDATLAIHCAFPAADVDVPAEEEGEHYGGFWICCFAYCTQMCVVTLFVLYGNPRVVCTADLIAIEEVALLNKGKEWDEKTYIVPGAMMDGVSKILYV